MEFSIKSEKLILRDCREEDEDIIVKQFTDPIIKNQILPLQSDEAYQRTFMKRAIDVAKLNPRTYYALTVTLHDETTIIGSCTLHNVYAESIETQLGWNFGREYWGKGYATEATRALFKIGFELNEVFCISAECFANSRAANRVLEKAGMKHYNNNLISQWFRALNYGVSNPVSKHRIWRDEYIVSK